MICDGWWPVIVLAGYIVIAGLYITIRIAPDPTVYHMLHSKHCSPASPTPARSAC
jgi:hypothetical protein